MLEENTNEKLNAEKESFARIGYKIVKDPGKSKMKEQKFSELLLETI